MGSWNVGPRDNDIALDYELEIFGCMGPQEPEEQMYTAWLVTQLNSDFPRLKDHAKRSLARMRALLDDNGWIDTWKNKGKLITSIHNQIKDLEQLLRF